ncbi:hypothetical protein BH10ACT7_BH10ACT7_18600 [soil metagenome]
MVTGFLLLAPAAQAAGPTDSEETKTIDFATDGLTGWTNPTISGRDTAVVGNTLRVSNKSLFTFGKQLATPSLTQKAAESGSGTVNTFDATFTVASATGAVQEGLNMEVAFDNGTLGRLGGNVVLYHLGGQLVIGTFWISPTVPVTSPATPNTAYTWNEQVIATVDPTVAHTVRAIVKFVPGTNNDVVEYYVDDVLEFTGTTWEHLYAVTGNVASPIGSLTITSGKSTQVQTGIPTFGNVPAVPSTNGNGFLLSDVTYSSYNITAVPTAPPVVEPDPDPTPGGQLTIPGGSDAGAEITAVGEGFGPFENVGFTVYSTPTFVGWAQANAFGVATLKFTLPAGLAPGSTHTVQAVGARSGWTVNSSFKVYLAATGSEDVNPMFAVAGAALLVAGGVLVALRPRPRRKQRAH